MVRPNALRLEFAPPRIAIILFVPSHGLVAQLLGDVDLVFKEDDSISIDLLDGHVRLWKELGFIRFGVGNVRFESLIATYRTRDRQSYTPEDHLYTHRPTHLGILLPFHSYAV